MRLRNTVKYLQSIKCGMNHLQQWRLLMYWYFEEKKNGNRVKAREIKKVADRFSDRWEKYMRGEEYV